MKRFLCLMLLVLFLFLLAAPAADATGRVVVARRAVVVNPFAFGFTFATPIVPVAAFAVPAAVAVQPVVQQPVVQAPVVTAAVAPVPTQAVVPTFAAVTPTFAATTFAFTPFASVAVATPVFAVHNAAVIVGHRRAIVVRHGLFGARVIRRR